MITYNGKALLTRFNGSNGSIKCKNTEGTLSLIAIDTYASKIIGNTDTKIVLGSGTTTPTKSDYIIETEINTLDSLNRINNQINHPNEEYGDYDTIFSMTETFKNNTNSNITVNEIAVYTYWSSANWGDNKYYMIYREVLDNPVTIEPDKTYAFSVTID